MNPDFYRNLWRQLKPFVMLALIAIAIALIYLGARIGQAIK